MSNHKAIKHKGNLSANKKERRRSQQVKKKKWTREMTQEIENLAVGRSDYF